MLQIMGGLRVITALVSALFTVLLILQLLSAFDFSRSSFLHSKNEDDFIFPISHETLDNPLAVSPTASDDKSQYLLGVGKADITGPVVEINLMGYADPKQVGSGLRQRLYSRAFIIGDTKNPEDRFAYLVLDAHSGDTAIRHGILQGLKALGSEYALYGKQNVAVTGTHSHSGPGAWLNYLLPQITSKGFHKPSYEAIVDGAILSIQRAHINLRPGSLSIGSITVEDANINRSLFAYRANPKKERAKYKHDVEKTMTLLKFKSASDGQDMGVLTWFPVHGTSMLGNNTLVSGDNKGVAAHLFEMHVNNLDSANEGFVAGFSQSSVGDTSPNVLGAYCEDGSGEQCNFEDSTCGGRNEPCHGRGPFFRKKDQGASSCFEIGRRQFAGAKSLYESMEYNSLPLRGSVVKSFHSFKDFSSFTFQHPNGSVVTTCPAALGYSFAAGTTDGPGAFDFKQNNTGSPDANPVWSVVSGLIHKPSEEQMSCHWPKPILLDVGEAEKPYLWTPNIVDIQILRVGQLIILISSGEATTMAGRRWKEAIASSASAFVENPIVVLGGPANSYTHYIATEEEYNIQRYEGASTLYGPHTLNAYINLTTTYLPYLSSNPPYLPLDPGPPPPIHTNISLSFIRGVLYDRPPFFKSFGTVLSNVNHSYHPGDKPSVTFVAANPRNNLRLEQTFAAVEAYDTITGQWTTVRDDADWSLVYEWRRVNTLLGTSEATVTWEIEQDAKKGCYRIRYFGDAKTPIWGSIVPFQGTSGEFWVV